jgi:hypothetical protein
MGMEGSRPPSLPAATCWTSRSRTPTSRSTPQTHWCAAVGGARAGCNVVSRSCWLQILHAASMLALFPGTGYMATCCQLQRASFLRLDEEYYAEVAAGRAAASGSTALAALVWGSQLVRACHMCLGGHACSHIDAGCSGIVSCHGPVLQVSADWLC